MVLQVTKCGSRIVGYNNLAKYMVNTWWVSGSNMADIGLIHGGYKVNIWQIKG